MILAFADRLVQDRAKQDALRVWGIASDAEGMGPNGSPGDPIDLSGIVVFLASDLNRYIAGQTYLVYRGVSADAIA